MVISLLDVEDEQEEPIVDLFGESGITRNKSDIIESSPISNAYSLTIKGFGKKDNLRCTS